MTLTVHDPGYVALRRAARAAILMPGLFAVCEAAFDNPQVALFAAFGSFAMLAFAHFGGPARKRFAAYIALTVGGAGLIAVATVVSEHVWLAVVGTAVVGFAASFGSVLGGYVAAGSLAATLSFVLAVAVPAGVDDIPARLLGWGLAGGACAVATLVLWPRYERGDLVKALAAAVGAVADLVGELLSPQAAPGALEERRTSALAATRALTQVYRTMPYRPAGPTAHDQAIAYLTDELPWLRSFADELAVERIGGDELTPADRRLGEIVLRVVRTAAGELDGQPRSAPDDALEAGREEYLEAFVGSASDRIRRGEAPDGLAGATERVFRFRLLSYLALSVGENVTILTGRPPRTTDFEIPPLVPSGSALQAVTGLGTIVRSHLRLDSVWVRAGLRAALGLGLAILIAELAELQHAFWVVLATLTVLKSNAVSTGYAAWQALAGTLAGFALASAVVIGVGDAQPALWALFPVCVFLAVYTPTVVHVVVGQAMFTVTIIVLFNLIEPEGWRTGLIRVEDILIGAGTAILVGALLWPRGARAQLRASLASLYETGSAYVRAALAATFDHGSQPTEAAGDARAAGLRAGEALSTYLNEHGPKRLPIEVWTKLLVTGEQLHLVGDAIVVRTSAYGRIEPFPQVAAAIQEEARRLDDEVDSVADAIAGRNGAELPTGSHAGGTAAIVRACLASFGRDPTRGQIEEMLWAAFASEWIAHVRSRLAALAEPIAEVESFASRAWWR